MPGIPVKRGEDPIILSESDKALMKRAAMLKEKFALEEHDALVAREGALGEAETTPYKLREYDYMNMAGDDPMGRRERIEAQTGMSIKELRDLARQYGPVALAGVDHIINNPNGLGLITLNPQPTMDPRVVNEGKTHSYFAEDGRSEASVDLYGKDNPVTVFLHEANHVGGTLALPPSNSNYVRQKVWDLQQNGESYSRMEDYKHRGEKKFEDGGSGIGQIAMDYVDSGKDPNRAFDPTQYGKEDQRKFQNLQNWEDYITKRTPSNWMDDQAKWNEEQLAKQKLEEQSLKPEQEGSQIEAANKAFDKMELDSDGNPKERKGALFNGKN
jgi:hypothetical protein